MSKAALVLAAILSLVLATPIPSARAADAPASAPEVFTRAVVRSISKDDGKHLFIRLKIVPRAKLPFSTLTYRVLDARLVEGLREGDSVAFKAERRDGENVLTAIQKAAPCKRFEECK